MNETITAIVDSVSSINTVKPWTGEIILSGVSLKSKVSGQLKFVDHPIDICSINTAQTKIYFRKHLFKSESQWPEVLVAIRNECVNSGYQLNLNGEYPRTVDGVPLFVRPLYCSHRKGYQHEKLRDVDPRDQPMGRRRSLVSDRKNQRKNGKRCERQTSTKRDTPKCPFSFIMYFDKEGFAIIPPSPKNSQHIGHKKLLPSQITLRKGEITKAMRDRMIEDAGYCMPVSATQRILNLRQLQNGSFVNRSLVREFRASNILKSTVDGSILKLGDNKGEMDLVLELLKKNKARVAYLAVQPKFGIDQKKLSNRFSNEDTRIVSSRPHTKADDSDSEDCSIIASSDSSCTENGTQHQKEDVSTENDGSFIVQTSHAVLRIKVIQTKFSYLEIDDVHEDSPLNGLVKKGDQIIAVNGRNMSNVSGRAFVEFLQSIRTDKKTISLWRGKRDETLFSSRKNISLEERTLCQDLRSIHSKDRIFTKEMYRELEKTAHKYRKEVLDPNQSYELFMSIAFVLPDAYLPGLMFSSVLYVDSTFNVCVFSNFRQFSIVCKNSAGKAFTICRIGLPHERSYLYDYVFQSVIPSLLSYLFPKRNRVICSDGCPFLCSSIDSALDNCYVNSIRLRCGWHITYKGFESNVQPYLVFHEHCSSDNRTNFVTLIHSWIYSWMRSNVCDSQSEFELSRDLLLSWLVSPEVVENICPLEVSTIIVKWIRTSVLPFEKEFAFYHRRSVENHSNFTCCCIEGTHNGLKHNSLGVERTDTLPVYIKKCNDYDIMKMKEMQATVAADNEKTYLYGKLWMNGLVEKGALLTHNIIQWSENYVSKFWKLEEGLPVFAVLYHGPSHEEENPIELDDTLPPEKLGEETKSKDNTKESYTLPRSSPKFHHCWVVKIVRTKSNGFTILCSCFMYKRDGIPCPHVHAVFHQHLRGLGWFEDFPDYFDYSVVWWKISYTLCYKPYGTHTEEELELLHKLLDLAMNDDRYGPELRVLQENISSSTILKHDWDSELKIGEQVRVSNCTIIDPVDLITKGASERLKNWKLGKDMSSNCNMVPTHHEFNFGEMKFSYDDSQAKQVVNSAIFQQKCKKKVLDMVYDIIEKVEFDKERDFFNKFSGAIDRFHAESVAISMKPTADENKAKTPSKIFAGSNRHTTMSPNKRLHAFHETPTKAPRKRKQKKDYNFSSP